MLLIFDLWDIKNEELLSQCPLQENKEMQNWDYLYLEYAEHDIFEDDSLHCRHHAVYEIRIGGSGGKIIDFSIGIQIL